MAKHIEAGKVQIVFLATSCNENTYKKLIQSLCLEKSISVVDVPDNKDLVDDWSVWVLWSRP